MDKFTDENAAKLADAIDFEKAGGLVSAIAQDAESGLVLMVGYQNRDAFVKSMTDGEVVYFSRTKQRLWKKGETSGHVQVIHDVKLDCDNDALVYSVEQVGGAACHTGRVSCFFQSPQPDGSWLASGAKIFNPDEVYSSSNTEKH